MGNQKAALRMARHDVGSDSSRAKGLGTAFQAHAVFERLVVMTHHALGLQHWLDVGHEVHFALVRCLNGGITQNVNAHRLGFRIGNRGTSGEADRAEDTQQAGCDTRVHGILNFF